MTIDEYKRLLKEKKGSKKTKYRSKKIQINGITFHSKKEAEYYKIVYLRLIAGDIKHFDTQIKYDLMVHGEKVGTYAMDFKITHNDNTIELVEVKGMGKGLETWILKWNILKEQLKYRKDISFTIAGKMKLIEKLKNKRSLSKPMNWYVY